MVVADVLDAPFAECKRRATDRITSKFNILVIRCTIRGHRQPESPMFRAFWWGETVSSRQSDRL